MSELTIFETQHNWICENILPSLPGADSRQVQRSFNRKLDHFLQRSGSWIDNARFVSDKFGNVELDFSGISARMVWINSVWHDNRELAWTKFIPHDYKRRTSSAPTAYTNTPYPDVIVLNPGPKADTLFTVEASCALTIDDCNTGDIAIPDWIFMRYKEVIRAGTLGDMMREIGKPYTNLTQARMYLAEYSSGVGTSRDEAQRGFGKHESAWMYPQGFAV